MFTNNFTSLALPSLYSANTGTKAWLKAPSANSLRKTLGIFMMTTKVSSATPAPNKPVITMSRTNPRIRETNVQKDTNPLLARSFKDFFCGETSWLRLTPLQMVLNPKKLS